MSRNVVVTGAGTGIGRAIALRFAAAGDSVVVTGRRLDPLAETARLGGEAVRAIACDGTDPDQLHALLDELPDRLHVLVNNAGGNTDFDQPDPDDLRGIAAQWRRNFDANVVTAVLTTRLLSDRLVDNASVVSIGSIAADNGAASYGAAKAALASWNLTAATELGVRGVTANVIAPGYISDTEFFRDRMTPQRREQLVAATLNNRVGVPSDIAETAFFLASEGARHISGQVVHVNGGAHTTR